MRKLSPFLVGVLCAWLCLSNQARADAGTPEYEDAIRLAIAEFDAGHWEEARALFRRAHEISPNARTWRGLGITAFELRRYVDAVTELEAALANPLKPLTDKQRQEIQSLLARAREFVSTYRLTVVPPGATLLVDGQPAELRDGELLLDPGTHTLLVRAAGYQDRHAELRADAGQREQLSIELQVERLHGAEAAAPPAAAVQPGRSEAAPQPRRVYAWTLTGVAAGALASAAVLRLLAADKSKEYTTECETDSPRCARLRDRGQRQELSANVMFGVAGGFALSAVLAYFLEGRGNRTGPDAALLVGPRSVGLTSSFEF